MVSQPYDCTNGSRRTHPNYTAWMRLDWRLRCVQPIKIWNLHNYWSYTLDPILIRWMRTSRPSPWQIWRKGQQTFINTKQPNVLQSIHQLTNLSQSGQQEPMLRRAGKKRAWWSKVVETGFSLITRRSLVWIQAPLYIQVPGANPLRFLIFGGGMHLAVLYWSECG